MSTDGEMDPNAFILLPAVASGSHALPWIEKALDAHQMAGSPEYRSRGIPYSIGPAAGEISFHIYEGLDSAFSGQDRTIERIFEELRGMFEKWEKASDGFHYIPKREYWHTEGNFDFIGALSAERRAAWRIQFMTRAFASGVRKICVMDASEKEQTAVRTYVKTLPWPFPMQSADSLVRTQHDSISVFFHEDALSNTNRSVWIVWVAAGQQGTEVEIPVRGDSVHVLDITGAETTVLSKLGYVSIHLKGDQKNGAPIDYCRWTQELSDFNHGLIRWHG